MRREDLKGNIKKSYQDGQKVMNRNKGNKDGNVYFTNRSKNYLKYMGGKKNEDI